MISSTGHGEIITDTKNRMKRGKQITLLGVMCFFCSCNSALVYGL